MKSKAMILGFLLILAPGASQAGVLDWLYSDKAEQRLFSVEADLARYDVMYPDQKRGKPYTVRFLCDIRVHVECLYEDGPGQYDMKVRRIENKEDPEKQYVVGFHYGFNPVKHYVEVAPVTFKQLVEGIHIPEAKGVPDTKLHIIVGQ